MVIYLVLIPTPSSHYVLFYFRVLASFLFYKDLKFL
jgi:hypothetical protein